MSEQQLKAFHDRLALLMNEIHKICIANGLRYTMMGGTLIGALRHKGFIPWDDDMDIALPYEDYKKFISIIFNQKHEWIEYCLAGKSDGYYSPFIKAYDTRTTFVEWDKGGKAKGIFIDIFPIVNAGNTKEEALREYNKHRFWQSLLKRKEYRLDTGIVRECVLSLVAKFFSVSYIMKVIDAHYDRLASKSATYSSDMDGTTKGIVPSYIFESYKMYKFGEYEYMGVEKSDEYLYLIFGDYMKLPPVEQQVPHHIKYINLNLPYRVYNPDIHR